MHDRPVHLIVSDDLERSRVSVFFRLILAIPHLIWLGLWGIAAALAVIANWFATLFAGQSPESLHNFLAAYVRYAIHVGAYLLLAAQPFPEFTGAAGYPVDVEIAPPQPQNRWKVAFRIVLAIPALMIAGALTSGGARSYGGAGSTYGLAAVAALLVWFAALARSRAPRGLRDVVAYGLSYSAQLDAYLFLLTDRYPNSDPQTAFAGVPVRGSDPIQLQVGEDLRRSPLTVFFRLILAIPHILWLILWGIVVFFAAIANWLATLVRGQSPDGLHNFLAAYVRYQTHVYAYLSLIAEPFPGFLGRPGSYPVEVSIAPPQPQNPWKVAFRLILGIPALILDSAYGSLLFAIAFLGWFASLATGSMPLGMRNAGALGLRYAAQAHGYLLLLCEVYPYSGPTLPATPEPSLPVSPAAMPTGL
ncbi:MAG: DUF4389 domain-containing protein [Solirubrobacteraceae bacterium]